ncbi:MAG TPA: hypothetical protein DCR14_06705 [Acidimicrobiaceae bacterium]|nr:hypothetical protein [Acidimicrobiaceae bacterium]
MFATGRPPMVAVHEVAAAGRGVHYGVMANGTLICTLPDGDVLHSITFSADLAADTVRAMRAHDPRFGFALATDRGFTSEPGFHERMPVQYSPGNESQADALVGHDGATVTIKLLAFHPELTAHDLLEQLPAVIGPGMTANHMGADAVELAPAGADKGVGLAWLCTHLGIDPADVLVFGDEVNDLPMFQLAGRRIAVENAHPLVKQAADEVTGPNSEEGVAAAIERLLADLRVALDPGSVLLSHPEDDIVQIGNDSEQR